MVETIDFEYNTWCLQDYDDDSHYLTKYAFEDGVYTAKEVEEIKDFHLKAGDILEEEYDDFGIPTLIYRKA